MEPGGSTLTVLKQTSRQSLFASQMNPIISPTSATHPVHPIVFITIFNKQWRPWSSSLSNTEETAQWCVQSTHNCEDNRTKNEDQNGLAMQTRRTSDTAPHRTTPHHTTPHHTTPHHTTPRFSSCPTYYRQASMKLWNSHELISGRWQTWYSRLTSKHIRGKCVEIPRCKHKQYEQNSKQGFPNTSHNARFPDVIFMVHIC